MHGIIFLALEDFLQSRLGETAWSRAMAEADMEQQDFSPDRFYPDDGAADLFDSVSSLLNLPLPQTLEQLGKHMSPGLVSMGRSMGLIQEEWKTLDILEHLPKSILAAFQNDDVGLKPPDIRTYRLKYGEVAVAYVSERRLCHLLKGIILGIGAFFEEPIEYIEQVCMFQKAPLCRLTVILKDPALKNYVDISREFHIVQSKIQEIQFFNQYHGIPIVNLGLIVQISDDTVLLQICLESLVSMREQGFTYLSLPHLNLGLKGYVSEVRPSQKIVALQKISLTDGPVGKRVFPRVVPTKRIDLELRIDKQTLRGWVVNLSEGGICILLKRSVLLEEAILFASVKIRFILPLKYLDAGEVLELGPKKIMLDGNILNMDETEGRHRVRIVFPPLPVNDAIAIREYFKMRQAYALKNLKRLTVL